MGGARCFIAWNLDIGPITTGHLADMSEAIKMLAPVEDIILDGEIETEYAADRDSANLLARKQGDDSVLLVSDYLPWVVRVVPDRVKLDLKAAGIPYRTKDGVADFHAAGRHTHITELLRNGTSLVEARELARHADVKMTMNYTHIGLEDRAKAVQNLPTDPKWLQMRCISGVPEGHLQSSDNTGCHSDAAGSGNTSPCETSPSGTHRQKKAPPESDGAQWRRRESNPRPVTFPQKPLRA